VLQWAKRFSYDFSGPNGERKIELLLEFVDECFAHDILTLAKQIKKILLKIVSSPIIK
jgi:hypothetical protein